MSSASLFGNTGNPDDGQTRSEEDPMERTICVDLTARELHVLTCAMAGNFPAKLNDVRMPTLRKLAKADRALGESEADAA